jgi:hypothetical protein
VLSFMLAQAERLRQLRSDADTQLGKREASRQVRRRRGATAAPAAPAKRVLFIDERLPLAGRDGGSQALLSHMRAFQRLGYAVGIAAAEAQPAFDEAARAALATEGVVCHGAPIHASVEDVLRREADGLDVVYLHRASIASRYLALARSYAPRARILYSVADLHHIRLERQAAIEERPELVGRRGDHPLDDGGSVARAIRSRRACGACAVGDCAARIDGQVCPAPRRGLHRQLRAWPK